jgi:CHAT domain/Tetratricopeptide repeat
MSQDTEDAARSRLLASLNARVRRFADSGDPSGVLDDAALGEVREVLRKLPQDPGDPQPATSVEVLQVLAFLYWSRYQSQPAGTDKDDLRAALEYFRLLGSRAPERVPEPVRVSLAMTALEEYQEGGEQGSLDLAISAFRDALAAPRAHGPDRAVALSGLAAALLAQYQHTGDHEQLTGAVQAGREAAEIPGPEHGRIASLGNLAYLLRRSFEETGDLEALAGATQAAREAAAAVPPGSEQYPVVLNDLAGILSVLGERTGQTVVLAEAVSAARAAVAATPAGTTIRAECLSTLGSALHALSARTGDIATLEEAAAAFREAARATPAGGTDRPVVLNSLSAALRELFDRTGDQAALDQAVSAARIAADTIPDAQPGRATCLTSLGAALVRLSQETGDLAALDEALAAHRAAADSSPPQGPTRPMYLSNLGNALVLRYEQTGDLAALDEALAAHRAAADSSPPQGPTRPMYLSNLGNALVLRYEQTGDLAALDEALAAMRAAAETAPSASAEHASLLLGLGTCRAMRSLQAGSSDDMTAALDSWRASAETPAAPLGVRLQAASRWAEQAFTAGRISDALDGYRAVVELLSLQAWEGRAARGESGGELRRAADLAADAAACAVAAGHPERAVEFVEHVRSLSWDQALGFQPEFDRLSAAAPDLARRLRSIRQTTSQRTWPASLMSAQDPVSGTRNYDPQSLLAREWDDLLHQIRSVEGFSGFLRPAEFSTLKKAARHGPVVILNVSRHGSHALVMRASSVTAVPLPQLTPEDALDRAGALTAALIGTPDSHDAPQGTRSRAILLDTLQWTWDTIAAPVLNALGMGQAPEPGAHRPHIWWCPTGPLTALPVHAAGHYTETGTAAFPADSVPGRAVSSYTSSLSALLRAEETRPPAHSRQLIVAMPDTPGHRPLPGISAEVAALDRYLSAAETDKLTGPDATRVSVLRALATHSHIHFACHGTQHPVEPSRSGLALCDGMLTTTDIASIRSSGPELVVLSACQTATANVRLTDEPKQLFAQLQYLGYRSVISTMWAVTDRAGLQLTQAIYQHLAASADAAASVRAAKTVDHVMRDLRRTNPDPLIWASLVHFGR